MLYQVQCQAEIDMVLYTVSCWFSLSTCYLVAAFDVWRLGIIWKINLDQMVGIHKNNLDRKGLKIHMQKQWIIWTKNIWYILYQSRSGMGGAWAGLIWLRIGTGGGLLWMR
jgi:hypothetical protein